jgi:prepilin-type N-terminal cleavage/methylation domain-containing protein
MHARTGNIKGAAATPRGTRGFTLIELAVVLFVITLILGSVLVPLTTQVEQRQVSDTEKTLQEIREALIGYAVANGNLPCPDTTATGTENVNAGTGRCTTIGGGVAVGRLPHLDLGLGNSDLWGNRFTYVVNELFARRGPNATPFTLSTAGNDVQICVTSACVAAAKLSTTAAFAVISHGKNGFGARNFATGNTNPASGSADEQLNYTANANVVSRPQFTGGPTASEFDDIVVWLSRYTLFNRMVSAGKLP